MSLFSSREWWTVAPGVDEEFGPGCVAVGNLDNDASSGLKIATGSFNGTLRVYSPRQREAKLEDLMLEVSLDLPILQLSAGRFLADSERVGLAVLHPRKLSVYAVTAGGGNGSDAPAAYYTLSKAYEHTLERPACNMVHGPFGGMGKAEHLCVQSMDGVLSVVEQERLTLSRPLAKFLLPGPFAYCAKIDSFITFNSQMEVNCYKYSSLSAVSVGQGGDKSKLQIDWALVVGEHVADIRIARFSRALAPQQVDIVVLAERTLICLKENGAVRSQKRLEYVASCCVPFASGSTEPGAPEHNLLVGTQTGSLMIYRDLELLWATKLPHPAASLAVGSFGTQPGLILSLGFDGVLTLSYLGTDPPSSTVGTDTKDLNYEAMDEEHRRLLQIIREASAEGKREPADSISLRAQVPTVCDAVGEGDAASVFPLTVRLFVSYSGAATIESVSLTASCTPPLYLTTDSVTLPSLAGSNRTPTIVPFTFRSRSDELPVDLSASIVATYCTASGESRCARCELSLPLCMVCRPIPTVKNPKYKITLDTNRMPPPLSALFEDVLATSPQMGPDAAVSALSLQYHCGLDATVLVSKNAGRYRIQSSAFEGLWLLADELMRRLKAYFGSASRRQSADSEGEEPFTPVYGEPLPLQEYFELIDEHLRCRIELAEANEQLDKRAHQFRVIEKRLLVRLKDRNPAPMQNLELLFEGTYAQLMQLASAVESAQQQLKFHGARLSSGTRLLLLLLRLRFALDEEDSSLLAAHLSPLLDETPDQGWEERTTAALTHLLRTGLAKSGKESAATAVQTLSRPTDATKLKKHITLVCDRLHKGHRPKGTSTPEGEATKGDKKAVEPT